MKTISTVRALFVVLGVLSFGATSHAAFHLWDIKEIYSNQDGSVQFIELFTTSNDQHVLNNHTLVATSDGAAVTFTFDRNLTRFTRNQHMLLATAGFGSLAGGVAPDYTLPDNFFDPAASNIMLNFANFDIVMFPGSLLPTDGVNSLTDQAPSGAQNLVAGVNSPTNFAGMSGSVDLTPPTGSQAGDYNNNGFVEQADLDLVLLNWGDDVATLPDTWTNQRPTEGIVDQVELDGVLLNWGASQLGATSVPEPASVALLIVILTVSFCVIRQS